MRRGLIFVTSYKVCFEICKLINWINKEALCMKHTLTVEGSLSSESTKNSETSNIPCGEPVSSYGRPTSQKWGLKNNMWVSGNSTLPRKWQQPYCFGGLSEFCFLNFKPNIHWRDVQRKNVVNNVDISSLRAPWQNGPYKIKHTEQNKHT